jgi:short-subunit dehydrogenase
MISQLASLHNKVIVVTGATSGIGLATVWQAVAVGAKVFMIARNEKQLQQLQDELRGLGHHTAYAVADVAEFDQLQFAADQCSASFGGIDVWVNNAGISIYAGLMDTTDDEARRLFDTNFWGVVNGCKVALPYLRESQGVLINIGSALSKVALPIQGFYSASKFAVKGFTDALRRELQAEAAPVAVSLVLPSAIDTPYTQHARSHIGEPLHRFPVYAADLVAKAILTCAVKPSRELPVGATALLFPVLQRWLPGLQDKLLANFFSAAKQRRSFKLSWRRDGGTGNLFSLHEREGEIKGNYPGHVMPSSWLTSMLYSGRVWSATFSGTALAWLVLRRLRWL